MKGMKQGTTWSLTGQKIIARNRFKLNVIRIDGGMQYRRNEYSVAEDKRPQLMYDSRIDGGQVGKTISLVRMDWQNTKPNDGFSSRLSWGV